MGESDEIIRELVQIISDLMELVERKCYDRELLDRAARLLRRIDAV